jgi:hypothetical protein
MYRDILHRLGGRGGKKARKKRDCIGTTQKQEGGRREGKRDRHRERERSIVGGDPPKHNPTNTVWRRRLHTNTALRRWWIPFLFPMLFLT